MIDNAETQPVTSRRHDMFENLGLLSQAVSYVIPEQNQIVCQDPFGIDAKLDFLCSLRLLPTPLVLKCPNATKKWLKTNVDTSIPIDSTGINSSYDELEYCSNNIQLSSLCMTTVFNDNQATAITNLTEEDQNFSVPITDVNVNDTSSRDDTHLNVTFENNINSIPQTGVRGCTEHSNNVVEEVVDTSVNSQANRCGNFSDPTNPLFQTVTSEVPEVINDSHTCSTQCAASSNPVDNSFKPSIHSMYSADRSQNNRTVLDFTWLPYLVSMELQKNEISQTVFAQATIGKTQGYLSSMLKDLKSLKILQNHDSPSGNSSACRNLTRVANFLHLAETERKKRYKEASEIISQKAKERTAKKQPRTKLSDALKRDLTVFFKEKKGVLSDGDYEYLSSKYNLTGKNIKIFYKNLKQRNKPDCL